MAAFPANKSGCKYWGQRDNSAKQRDWQKDKV